MTDLNGLLFSPEERLAQHDSNVKEVQAQLHDLCNKTTYEAYAAWGSISEEIASTFATAEKRNTNVNTTSIIPSDFSTLMFHEVTVLSGRGVFPMMVQ